MKTVVASLVLVIVAGCTVNLPGRLVPTTAPVDDASRIHLVGKEAIGRTCQWWISANGYFGSITMPIPVEGNLNFLAVRAALGEEYDGLIDASVDRRITPWGLGIPTSSNPQEWVHLFLIENCQEIRGTPFVYTSSPFRGE